MFSLKRRGTPQPRKWPRRRHQSRMQTAQPKLETGQEELIRRIQAGGSELFYDLIQPHEKSVYFAAFSVLGNPADAEEVAQEALLKAFKNLGNFRLESKFSTWLVQIAINEALMRRRKDHKHLYESIEGGLESDEGDYVPRDF